jgi:anti-repressor protein
MEELVFKSEKGTPVTTSLLVAEKFGKRHADVLRDIRNLNCSEDFHKRNFALLVEMKSLPQGGATKAEYYLITKDGFTFLVMGYTGEQAGKFKEEYINAFNKMEAIIKTGGFQIPASFREALLLAAQQQEQIELQQKQLSVQAPKVLFADAVATSDRSVLISELAKILKQNGVEIGQNRLFIWLRNNGYLCNKGEYYNQPAQKAMQLGLFEIKKTTITKPDGSVLVTCTTKVTGKGQIYFTNKFLKKTEIAPATPIF